ncbi:MAG: family 78 glycoside hydrolase catalytic domain [Bacteroidales bacterium]|jgi:hypothetical protein|nr:family 78 glycoside hydrolase catalytic domain [Bacteroidales bacterium]
MKTTFPKSLYLFISLILLFVFRSFAAEPPTGLTTDLLEHTDRIFLDGYPANFSLEECHAAIERYQLASIRSEKPYFGWIMNDNNPNTLQTAYRILVASNAKILAQGLGDMWDSGNTASENSTAVQYAGKPLQPSTVYYWKVQTWNNHGEESPFSQPKSFITAATLDNHTARYPLQITDEYPVRMHGIDGHITFIDFGKAAFGRLRITLSSPGSDTVIIHLGESVKGGRIDRKPGGSIRYTSYRLPLMPGTHSYLVKIRPDRRNTGSAAILMPDYTGEVIPFRYCELEGYGQNISKADVIRQSVHYPFNEQASHFYSSDSILNQIWDLCKYSIKATSFTGTYVDGDRERIPYEADALINQLSHYCLDREFSMGRYSHEYLIENPTWPTEWIIQSVLMAWHDYLYTGNPASLQRFYVDLKAKTLTALTETNGLISTRTGKQTSGFLKSIHFGGKAIRDIVDWPQSGVLGVGKESPGEADAFVFTDYNTVVNAYHYEALQLMSLIAGTLGKTDDCNTYRKQAQYVKQQFNKLLLDSKKGYYNDGIDTDHSSLHANIFPLAFDMVPAKNSKTVTDFVRSRGMACSVYGAQFLMDAVYNGNDSDYGFQLLSSTAERSWYNMIRAGSTITLEAWGRNYKPNLDWNHAWGAVPANIIPRKLMGIEPLEPGFRKIRIKPQPSSLSHAEIVVPSIRGNIKVSFNNTPGTKFEMEIEIPANTVAEVWLPLFDRKQQIIMNGVAQKGTIDGIFVKLQAGSGKHRFLVQR